MNKTEFVFTVRLSDTEFIQIGEHIYTTRQTWEREEPRVHLIPRSCIIVLHQFEGKLTPEIVDEWLLLNRALDQSCNFENKWDDKKILKELVEGNEHPFSWYVKNCQDS